MSRPCQTLHLVRLYHAQPHDWLTGSALATRGHMPATTHAHDHPFVMQHGRPATQSAASHHVFIPSCTACVLQGRLFTRTPHRTLVLHSNNPPPPHFLADTAVNSHTYSTEENSSNNTAQTCRQCTAVCGQQTWSTQASPAETTTKKTPPTETTSRPASLRCAAQHPRHAMAAAASTWAAESLYIRHEPSASLRGDQASPLA